MLESFTIGSVEIPSLYIAFLLAMVISYLMVWGSDEKKKLFSHWLNGAVILFLVYKLAYIPFNWNSFVESPLNVLYENGGQWGVLIGLIVMFIYMIYHSSSLYYAEAYSVFSVAFIALYGVLELRTITQWPYIMLVIVSLVALIAIYLSWRRFRAIALMFITLFITQLVVRFFIYNGEVILSLSLVQWWITGSIIYVLATTEKGMRDENGP